MHSTYFGFQKEPFSSNIDPAFFQAHGAVREVSGSLLFSQLSQRRGFTLVIGQAGVGKTALLLSILEQDRTDDCTVYLSCGESWSFARLLERWCDALGAHHQVPTREDQIHAVIDYLSARSQGSTASTLLLDQAENLTDDALEGLAEFSKIERGGSALVQIILAARPEIAARLDQTKLHKVSESVKFRTRLEPIKHGEVGDYVRHRLEVAGYDGPTLFPDDAVEAIATASRGVAAHINLMCYTALQLTELAQERFVSLASAEQAIEACSEYVQESAGGSPETSRHPEHKEPAAGAGAPVPLALKARSQTDESIWPMRIDGDPLPMAEDVEAEVPAEAASEGRRRGGMAWLTAAFIAAGLVIGAGVAWYQIPTDRLAQLWPERTEPLVAPQDPATSPDPVASEDPPPQAAGVSKPPRLVIVAAQGYEDQAIPLEIRFAGLDRPLAQQPVLTLTGLPPGTTLSAGKPGEDGTWHLEADDLPGLTLRPPNNFSGSFKGELTAVLGDPGHDGHRAKAVLPVKVAGVADPIQLEAHDATGKEDEPVPLDIRASLTDTDGSETLRLLFEGLPKGATLSAGKVDRRGRWMLPGDGLDGVTLTPPEDFSGSLLISVRATATEDGERDQVTEMAAMTVTVLGVADPPRVETVDVRGKEDQRIALQITTSLADRDGSESLEVLLSGMPEGTMLSRGERLPGGTWRVEAEDLPGLSLLPPENLSGAFLVTVEATSRETDSGDLSVNREHHSVTVLSVADMPKLAVQDAVGREDVPIPLNIRADLVDDDGSEGLSILLNDLPDGARLSAGTIADGGQWALVPDQLSGLTLLPPENFAGSFEMKLAALARENDSGDSAVRSKTMTVLVEGVPDTPKLTAKNASGQEDAAIPLDIAAALTDGDGSEDLTVVLSAKPEGVRFSAGEQNGHGNWNLRGDQLASLQLSPPPDFSGDIEVTIDAIAREKDGEESAKASGKLTVRVAEVADPPRIAVKDARGQADQPIPLHVSAGVSDGDGSEKLTVSLAGLPAGARLSSGKPNAEGDWLLTAEQLPDLKLLTPDNFDGAFEVTALATTVEHGGDSASVSAPFKVSVTAAAPSPEAVEDVTDDIKTPGVEAPVPETAIAGVSANRMKTRGDEYLALGDVVTARLFYEFALDEGAIEANSAIAKTYDPLHLSRLGIERSLGDRAKAIEWYRRAAEGGDPEAVLRLKDLTAPLQ